MLYVIVRPVQVDLYLLLLFFFNSDFIIYFDFPSNESYLYSSIHIVIIYGPVRQPQYRLKIKYLENVFSGMDGGKGFTLPPPVTISTLVRHAVIPIFPGNRGLRH